MKKMYSLQMDFFAYSNDIHVCSTALSMINYCRAHDISVDGFINRIALVSVDDDGYVALAHEFYRICYDDTERYLIPVDYLGRDLL